MEKTEEKTEKEKKQVKKGRAERKISEVIKYDPKTNEIRPGVMLSLDK